jgi:D-hydroxyproline dehydrogenase subunit gamma
MPEDAPSVRFTLNGSPATATAGSSIAAALLANGVSHFRRSANGSPRAPLCGMGICYECRVKVNGELNVKSCLAPVEEGIEVQTDE